MTRQELHTIIKTMMHDKRTATLKPSFSSELGLAESAIEWAVNNPDFHKYENAARSISVNLAELEKKRRKSERERVYQVADIGKDEVFAVLKEMTISNEITMGEANDEWEMYFGDSANYNEFIRLLQKDCPDFFSEWMKRAFRDKVPMEQELEEEIETRRMRSVGERISRVASIDKDSAFAVLKEMVVDRILTVSQAQIQWTMYFGESRPPNEFILLLLADSMKKSQAK